MLAEIDTSEVFERKADTLQRLHRAGLLHADTRVDGRDTADRTVAALDGGELLNVIEYHRGVYAESKRSTTPRSGASPQSEVTVRDDLCHLCYKHRLSTQLAGQMS